MGAGVEQVQRKAAAEERGREAVAIDGRFVGNLEVQPGQVGRDVQPVESGGDASAEVRRVVGGVQVEAAAVQAHAKVQRVVQRRVRHTAAGLDTHARQTEGCVQRRIDGGEGLASDQRQLDIGRIAEVQVGRQAGVHARRAQGLVQSHLDLGIGVFGLADQGVQARAQCRLQGIHEVQGRRGVGGCGTELRAQHGQLVAEHLRYQVALDLGQDLFEAEDQLRDLALCQAGQRCSRRGRCKLCGRNHGQGCRQLRQHLRVQRVVDLVVEQGLRLRRLKACGAHGVSSGGGLDTEHARYGLLPLPIAYPALRAKCSAADMAVELAYKFSRAGCGTRTGTHSSPGIRQAAQPGPAARALSAPQAHAAWR